MHAGVHIEAHRTTTGRTAYPVLRSEPPLTARLAGDAVWLVGTAAGPLGRDRVDVRLVVGEDAALEVRSAAATVVLAGDPQGSEVAVQAEVGVRALLDWRPEPLVATRRCRHRSTARVTLAPGAALVWREELIAGRSGEEPGTCTMDLRVDGPTGPVLRHEVRIGPHAPGWAGPAVLDGARAIGTIVIVGLADLPSTAATLSAGAVVQPLAAGGVLVSATARSAAAVRDALDEACEELVTRRSRSRFVGTGGGRGTMV